MKSVGARWSLERLPLKLELMDGRDWVAGLDIAGIGAEGTRFGRGGIVAAPLPMRPEVERRGLCSPADGGRLWARFGSSGVLSCCRAVFPVAMHGIASISVLAGSKSALKVSITSSIGGGGDGKLNSWQ